MRIAASVVGVVGGLFGIYFGQMLITVAVVLSLLASASGSSEVEFGEPFNFGALALACYALGVAGGVLALTRPRMSIALFLVGALGGFAATSVVGGPGATASSTDAGMLLVTLFPHIGPGLLLLAAGLSALAVRAEHASPAAEPVAATEPAIAHRAELASAVPVPLLSQPALDAQTTRQVAPGTPLDSYEQRGVFVHVRGPGFEGYLPEWSVRQI